MMNLKIIIVLLGLVLFSVSCNEKTEKQEIKSELALVEDQTTENLQKISLEIEGMTCEIGCARTIESKLSKKKGVKSAKVSFEDEKGVIEFDANKITESQVVEVVNKIADGGVYKVVKTTKLE
jgi:Cu+-exporting ATPase